MAANRKLLILPGDGIGPEVMGEVKRVVNWMDSHRAVSFDVDEDLVGGCAYDAHGAPLSDATMQKAMDADAVLLGAVGGPKWDKVERAIRPERGLLRLRSELGFYCNLRPAVLYPALADASSLRPEVVAGLDVMIIRELTGGIYFGQPRGIEQDADGHRRGFNTLVYRDDEIERIARSGFEIARKRNGRLCSVDKANVLEVSELWREVVDGLAPEYPDVELSHMYVDNAAMQLVRAPKQFDVLVTTNMFGDILSDLAAMLTGSIGMLPSASLDAASKGLFEPVHGSAPDIAGQGVANPLATILSASMMLRYTLDEGALADRVEAAVGQVLAAGVRTADIAGASERTVGTQEMTAAVIAALDAV